LGFECAGKIDGDGDFAIPKIGALALFNGVCGVAGMVCGFIGYQRIQPRYNLTGGVLGVGHGVGSFARMGRDGIF
jgi:hypothetical protein